ncbi:MAG: SRPBCC family protein [Carbonactinosporaceae bacterium]
MEFIAVDRTIAAPVERVWEVFTDIGHSDEHLSGVTAVEMLSEGAFGVGTRWRETRSMFGRSATEEMWVAECEPPRRYVVRADDGGRHYVSELSFEPEGEDATVARMTFGQESPGLLARTVARLVGPVFLRQLTRMLRQDLDDLARVCESSPGPDR